ncbi:MAG: phosphate ABC transporter substrate-binding protein, partial [Thermoproteota archaeon]
MLKKSTLAITTLTALWVAGVAFLPLVVSAENQPVPSWIKGVAGFWSSNKISDNEFINAMEFLINSGTIKVTKNLLVSPDVDKLTVGFIPTEKAEDLTPKASELEKYLEKELGIDVA